jgi:hypothetical protein
MSTELSLAALYNHKTSIKHPLMLDSKAQLNSLTAHLPPSLCQHVKQIANGLL